MWVGFQDTLVLSLVSLLATWTPRLALLLLNGELDVAVLDIEMFMEAI